MKQLKISKFYAVLSVLFSLLFTTCVHDQNSEYSANLIIPEQGTIPNQYIVRFKDGVVNLEK